MPLLKDYLNLETMKQLLTTILLFLTLIAYSQTTPRYFLVSYSYSNGTGSVGVSSTTYPSKAAILSILRKNYVNPSLNVVITNIMEFKTKDDFIYFFSGSSTYYDTVITQKQVVSIPLDSNTERTWYFRDLGIRPNTGQCLTDRVNKVMDSALSMGGKTTIIISDAGLYNYTSSEQASRNGANVQIDVGCYPDGGRGISEILVDKCSNQ
jgi:hypothetical protein